MKHPALEFQISAKIRYDPLNEDEFSARELAMTERLVNVAVNMWVKEHEDMLTYEVLKIVTKRLTP